MDTFRGLPMAMEAARIGGSMPTVFNAANEMAVAAFLDRKIRFLDIYEIIGDAMASQRNVDEPDLEQILAAEQETYEHIRRRHAAD